MFLLHWCVPQDDLDLDDNKVIIEIFTQCLSLRVRSGFLK